MDISSVRELVSDDMKKVNATILDRLASDVVLINQVGNYIVNSGGKRLRPLIVLLVARALGYNDEAHIELAAIIEFIHTATLLHDDVVDGSDLRRNQDTANAVWGNEASVLVGDFLYSRSFEMMVDIGKMRVMEVLSHATNRIAEGEVLQLLNCNEPGTSEKDYRQVIERKTATLFEAGTRLGAVLAEATPDIEQAMAAYGHHLGIAFQLIDDALDYSDASEDIGKNIGDDLAEGKPTLPLIRAMQTGNEAQRRTISDAIVNGDVEAIDRIKEIIESTDAIAYTARLASDEANKAKQALELAPPSVFREALAVLADFSVSRTS
ncbi:MAG TPA: octaprenyl diphosphate synthase [Chromatiaceae bacterium]|nr:octaprenyl diphosphate synthase [Chromatiaceae bacterium]